MSGEPWRAPWVSQISESLGLPPPVESIRVTHNGTNLLVTWDDAAAGANRYDVTTYDTGGHRNWRGAWNPAGTSLFPQLQP